MWVSLKGMGNALNAASHAFFLFSLHSGGRAFLLPFSCPPEVLLQRKVETTFRKERETMVKFMMMLRLRVAKLAEAVRSARRARADAAEWKRRCEILAENSKFLQRGA